MKSEFSPEISVIIPAYNAERTIYRTLQSLEEADYPKDKLEILVVDNNSTDETALVVEKFPVKVIKEERQGRSIARNRGVKESKGEFLFFLDADVFVEKNYFKEIISVLGHSYIGGVQGTIIPSDVDGQESINKYRKRVIGDSTGETFCLLNLVVRESPMVNSAACAYRREAFELVGGFDEALERHEDIDLARRVSYSGYALASAEKARAHVIYHGEGWLSYFKRSFDDGFTKIDYNRKWSLPQEWPGDEKDGEYIALNSSPPTPQEDRQGDNSEEASSFIPSKKKIKKKEFNKFNYVWWSLRELAQDIFGFLKTGEFFFILRFINHFLRLLGRVLSPIRSPRHQGCLVIPMAAPAIRLKKVVDNHGRAFFLKPTLRFILLSRTLYLIDCDGHRLLAGDSSLPHFFSYATFHRLGLFTDFEGDKNQDMIFSMLKSMELLA